MDKIKEKKHMKKEEVHQRLKAVCRQITCMNPKEFEESFKDGEIKFDHHLFTEPAKIEIIIIMKKIPIE